MNYFDCHMHELFQQSGRLSLQGINKDLRYIVFCVNITQ